jgi:hypothetical protein
MVNFPDELESRTKVIRTIKSCNNKTQLKTATRMVGNYYKIFPNRSTFYYMNRIIDMKERSFQLKRLEE